MYKRSLKKPKESILLLGPRGTGKSTWIASNFEGEFKYNLLDSKERIRLARDPSIFFNEVRALNPGSWVLVDEIQKVPELMDEVHRLIEDFGYKFILTGSSARKIKRGAANLLAGRAITCQMFPFCYGEVELDNITRTLNFGRLPKAVVGAQPQSFLKSYVDTYLKEEIIAEALTRNIGAFSRFLEVAARQNGQLTNLSNISRDAEIGRSTVDGYFSVLVDTLIGFWLPIWRVNSSTKLVGHPKFYFFDTGVVRALGGRISYEPQAEEMGALLETFILHELKSFLSYKQLYYDIFYWRNHNGMEVDVVFEAKEFFYAIEIKATSQWRESYCKGLNSFSVYYENQKKVMKPLRKIGVYLGSNKSLVKEVEVFPVKDFLGLIWNKLK